MNKTLISHIASTCDALHNCRAYNNEMWAKIHTETLQKLEQLLPSGSGVDAWTKILVDKSTRCAVYLETSFHHMNEAGFYDGWTEHTIKVSPEFDGFDLRISGKNRNQIKEYLGELFHHSLSQKIVVDHGAERGGITYRVE